MEGHFGISFAFMFRGHKLYDWSDHSLWDREANTSGDSLIEARQSNYLSLTLPVLIYFRS